MSPRASRRSRGTGTRWAFGALSAVALAAFGALSTTGSCLTQVRQETPTSSSGTDRRDGGPSSSSGAARPPSSSKGGGSKGPSKGVAIGPPPATVHLEMGVPVDGDPSDDHLMIKPQYALSYNKARNGPSWVSWNLNASYFGDVPRFKGKFLSDPALPDDFYHARHDDYVGSGYDRGHMVRSEERTRTAEDNKATFLMTNILPQQHDLNAGPWLRLEEFLQELAQKQGRELFIVAGGIFGKRPPTIGKDIVVPQDFFKIAVVLDKGQGAGDVEASTRIIAVVMPNTTGIMSDEWGRYRNRVDEIEKRTGYDFLTRVPAAVQAIIEARTDDGPITAN